MNIPKWRKVLAPILGIAVAGLCLALIEAALHTRLHDDALFASAAAALAVGAAAGGFVARKLVGRAFHAWIVAAALFGLSLVNVFSFPHPVWFVPVAALAAGTGVWLATRGSKGIVV